jgi:DNA-binding Lrp family transcriptional regulator
MPEAFVCINASPDSVEEVITKLKACKEVKETFRVHGVYDIIARISRENLEDLSDFVEKRLKSFGDIQKTLSMLLINPSEPLRNNEPLLF